MARNAQQGTYISCCGRDENVYQIRTGRLLRSMARCVAKAAVGSSSDLLTRAEVATKLLYLKARIRRHGLLDFERSTNKPLKKDRKSI